MMTTSYFYQTGFLEMSSDALKKELANKVQPIDRAFDGAGNAVCVDL
jgi:hypothetical protein